jgi:hypothetical protein
MAESPIRPHHAYRRNFPVAGVIVRAEPFACCRDDQTRPWKSLPQIALIRASTLANRTGAGSAKGSALPGPSA